MQKLQKNKSEFFEEKNWSLKKYKKILKDEKKKKKQNRRAKMFNFCFRNERYVKLMDHFYYLSDLILKKKEKRGYDCGGAFKQIKITIKKKDGAYINERFYDGLY